MSENEILGSTSWNQAQFVGKIIKATKGHDISELELPQTIDLTGKLTEVSDGLMAATLLDPAKKERARVGVAGHDGKLKLSEETVGEKRDVVPKYSTIERSDWRGSQYSKDEYASLVIHTHGAVDHPPSPQDLISLLTDIEDRGIHASIIITPSTRFLLIRTLQTPTRTREEIQEVIEEHERKYKEALNAERLSFVKHMKKFGGVTEENLEKHLAKMDPIIQINLLNDSCRENHIAIYTAVNGGIYKRAKY